MLEKIQSFADGKYDLSRSDVDVIYDENIGDISERVENLGVVQRQVSTGPSFFLSRSLACLQPCSVASHHTKAHSRSCAFAPTAKIMSQHGGGSLGRASSTASSTRPVAGGGVPPSRTASSSSYKSPPPARAAVVAAPPAYSGSPVADTKRAPPPPPPLKAKPSYGAPAPKYVVALFDFEAQVRTLILLARRSRSCRPRRGERELTFVPFRSSFLS